MCDRLISALRVILLVHWRRGRGGLNEAKGLRNRGCYRLSYFVLIQIFISHRSERVLDLTPTSTLQRTTTNINSTDQRSIVFIL